MTIVITSPQLHAPLRHLHFDPSPANILAVQTSARVYCISFILKLDISESRWTPCNPNVPQWTIIRKLVFELLSSGWSVSEISDVDFVGQVLVSTTV
jgi:hypothetical protein